MTLHQRLSDLSGRLKAIPKWIWLLSAIIALGIFLRTYEFRDWMIFNPDQARDALLVQDMLQGKQWPLMGPQAGNTYFRLGPIFYYFEYAAAWLFGPSAEKMAYPDLLFSILTIGLMYVFLRRFFERNLTLLLTFLFSLSFFVVTYSRFAFNPNSIPFFTLLFLLALLQILDHAPREKLGWSAVLGIAMGVGFQLHTILFITLPFVALLTLGYLFVRKQFVWKSLFVALACFALVNTGQLISEVRYSGANIQSFFSGAGSDARGTSKNFWRDLTSDTLCHIQGETYILTSLGSGDKCDLPRLWNRIGKKGWVFNADRIAIALFGAVFVLGGMGLFVRALRQEQDLRKKRALVLVAVYSLAIFAILFLVSSNVSIRYFIVIEFVPFLLAGFWLKLFSEKLRGRLASVAGLTVLGLTACNIVTYQERVAALRQMSAGDDNVAYFGEVARMSQYLLERSPGAKNIRLSGKKAYLARYGKPLEYFGREQGIAINKAYKTESLKPGETLYYVLKKITKKNTLPEVKRGFQTVDAFTLGNVTVLELRRVADN